jgi:hypothetical protein
MRCDYHHPRLPRCNQLAGLIVKVDHDFIKYCECIFSIAIFDTCLNNFSYLRTIEKRGAIEKRHTG